MFQIIIVDPYYTVVILIRKSFWGKYEFNIFHLHPFSSFWWTLRAGGRTDGRTWPSQYALILCMWNAWSVIC